MIFRATDWMSSRWWAALAVVMAFILVARTGTVGAPAAAARIDDDRPMTRRFAQRDLDRSATVTYERARRSLESHVRDLEDQLTTLQSELDYERRRAEILASGYESLEAKFDSVTSSVRGLVEADARVTDPGLAPAPIEAIFVHGLEESADVPQESDR